ncbi:MAG: ribokinase [Pseudomonadota bacterium]
MIFNLGSINSDHVYSVPRIPQPGETQIASALSTGLGGKGANMSVAAVRAGGTVRHIGAVGPDGSWTLDQLSALGVIVDNVARTTEPTGHAHILLDPGGENAITVFPGANRRIAHAGISAALDHATRHDTLILQNETNGQRVAARIASGIGMRVMYCAAPFDADAVSQILDHATVLILNAVEARQLQSAVSCPLSELGVETVIVTKGPEGATLHRADGGTASFPAPAVDAVDTTGAGDTFAGVLASALDAGQALETGIETAVLAASLMTTRHGTARAIPTASEVSAFRIRIR